MEPTKKKLRTMAGLEYYFMLRELSPLVGRFISKFYELEDGLFRLRFGELDLLAQLGVRMHLTKYISAAPQTPSNFCEFVRKRLDGKKLVSLSQHGMDRIIYAKFSSPSEECTLAFEMFAKGNLLVLDSQGKIMRPYRKEEWKERRLAKGETYKPPPSCAIPFPPSQSQLCSLFSQDLGENKYAVVSLNSLSIGTAYVNEALLACSIQPKTPSASISALQALELSEAFSRMHSSLLPLLYKQGGKPADFSVFPLSQHRGLEKIQCASLCAALDEYYSSCAPAQASSSFDKKKAQLESRLQLLRQRLEQASAQAQQCSQAGNAILENQQKLLAIAQHIKELRSEGKSWEEIAEGLKKKKIEMEKSGSVFYAEL